MKLKRATPGPIDKCKNPAHARSKKGDSHGAA